MLCHLFEARLLQEKFISEMDQIINTKQHPEVSHSL